MTLRTSIASPGTAGAFAAARLRMMLCRGLLLMVCLFAVSLHARTARAVGAPVCNLFAQSAFAKPPLRALSGATASSCTTISHQRAATPLPLDPNSLPSEPDSQQLRMLPSASTLVLAPAFTSVWLLPIYPERASQGVLGSVYRPPR